VGIAPTRTGRGYWLVASDGGIFSFGDAKFYGSTGNIRLNQPIVGMAANPIGRGYWMVARDGGIFSFGDAKFYGSTGNIRLNQPIVGMAANPKGRGYWMVARDGGIFTFGSAKFRGSLGAIRLAQPIVGMSSSRTGRGYVLVAADGGVFTFGDAKFYGSAAKSCPDAATIGVAGSRNTIGYWIGLANARTYAFSPTAKSPVCIATPADGVARDLFGRLNSERAARGLPPLQWDGALAGYAKAWSRDMASNGFRHSAIVHLLDDGRLSYVGENIAWARGAGVTSSTLHTMWMQSQGHRDNMLSPTYNAVGIGVFCAADGTVWATQDFGRYSSLGPGSAAPTTSQEPFVRRDAGGSTC
jgi:ribosomal protein L24E